MYTIGGQLYHHGILGMHWGIRRYQPYSQGYNAKNKGNFTGKLTDKQKNKYYEKDEYNILRLNKKGQKENVRKEKRIQKISDATHYNVKAANKDYDKKIEEYKKLKEEDSKIYEEEWKKFLRDDDPYKGIDYYDFKDKAYANWTNTENFKKQKQVREELQKMVEDAAKAHPLYSKNYWVFEKSSLADIYNRPVEMKNKNVGKEVVNRVMSKIDDEARKNISKKPI